MFQGFQRIIVFEAYARKGLDKVGFFNKTYIGQGLATGQFNDPVFKEMVPKFDSLYEPFIFAKSKFSSPTEIY